MVSGINSFKEKFSNYENCYTIIGGAACEILMSEVGTEFRATKDVDMILILEDRYQEFANVFWEYIKEGGYKCGWKNSDTVHFYRFTDPNPGYPVQIELFSRNPGYHLEAAGGIIPIHIDDDTSSLSAILLNDDYYHFMLSGRKTVMGLSVLGAEYLIPFKMFAWLDLKARKASGEHVNDRDLRKHKNDVFRLLQIVPGGIKIDLIGLVQEKTREFMTEVVKDSVDCSILGLPFDFDEGMRLLQEIYL
ncbi:MAG: hypothetical protein Q4E54_08240 [Lachnospiraceae bacterium]|nr:hypothetical protein [Lachnospiraceae bacterium]